MLGSSLGSTWFRQGSTQRILTESYVFKTVCLGFGLGSSWFPAVAPQTSWFRPWFHVVPICFRDMGTSRRCLLYEHSCLFPALVPLGSDMAPPNGISPSSIFSKQCVGSGFGSTWFPHGSAKRNLTEQNVFKLFFAIMLASGVTRYRLASWFLVHARRLYYVPLLKKFHSHVGDLALEIERAKR